MSRVGGDRFQLEIAAGVLLGGGVVLHATEGVWGLACDPFQADAVWRIAELKGREPDKGFVMIGDRGSFDPELELLEPALRRSIEQSWPGPVSWAVPGHRFPAWITAPDGTAAIRVPGHDQARRLSALCGTPLVSTSANPAGRRPATSALAARRYFQGRVDYLLPGRVGRAGGPSEIRIAATGRVMRPGI